MKYGKMYPFWKMWLYGIPLIGDWLLSWRAKKLEAVPLPEEEAEVDEEEAEVDFMLLDPCPHTSVWVGITKEMQRSLKECRMRGKSQRDCAACIWNSMVVFGQRACELPEAAGHLRDRRESD